jgi:hypothetical protein
MKLTSQTLDRLIREVIAERKNKAFRSDYEREEHLRKQQEEAETRRKEKEEIVPGLSDLTRLSKGIISEGELLAEPDEKGFVKIQAAALEKLLNENTDQLQKQCNAASYYKVDQILSFIAKMNKAQKGK